MDYNTLTLPNGLRIIHRPSASQVVYCGYQIAAGTRHEQPGEEGLAHFCEHVTFKGTSRRNALQIINELENVGGELNAFTNKESTTFYAAVLHEHVGRAVDLLTDIVFHSTYPQDEIEKEVEVICDEIESYNDSPAELIYDEFENILFKGHPLGHNILGTASQLHTYTTADALRFTQQHYRPANAIFFVDGNVDFSSIARMVEQASAGCSAPEKAAAPDSQASPVSSSTSENSVPIIRNKSTHQAHVMLGCLAYDFRDTRRMPLYLLNNILGGPAMNARLNLTLREQHGLVYTVESSMVSYTDTGLWSVYFGCDAHDVDRCCQLVRSELDTLMKAPLKQQQLAVAKQQLKGQLAIACDNREQFSLDFGKSFLYDGRERDLDKLFASIDAVEASQIQRVACELFAPERLVTLIYK